MRRMWRGRAAGGQDEISTRLHRYVAGERKKEAM